VPIEEYMNGASLENPFARSFFVSVFILCAIAAAALCIVISPSVIFVPIAAALLIWAIFRYPVRALGIALAWMPVDFMVISLGKFYGLPHMTLISVLDKEVLFLLLTLILWRKNGFTPAAPDWILFACVTLATIRTIFSGSIVGLWTDFYWVIPYLAGRMTVLTATQQKLWATCAIWIAGMLSILGLAEVFIFGEIPRTALYIAIESETDAGKLTSSFYGTGFGGLREAATMVGPNAFGMLCMVALILWWVYCRHPLPAGMAAVGLLVSLTRSAWVGAAVGIPVIALLMRQGRRLFAYGMLVLALFAASIPVLGLDEFIHSMKTGEDTSAEGHRTDILDGLQYAISHPLGAGNNTFSTANLKETSSATIFETTYPQIAAEYGIATSVCLIGFLSTALYVVWRQKSLLGYVGVGILIAIGVVMVVTLPLQDRRLACWVCFPIGLAVKSCTVQKRMPISV
jgi:hypothetical protein